MKASDTVMPFSQIEAIDLKNAESNFTDALYDVAREQAEISFKAGGQLALEKQGMAYLAGKQAGIEEGYKRGLNMKPDPDGVYKNGLRDGRREVVEWINNNCYLEQGQYGTPDSVGFWVEKWQSKLKDWGLEA